MEETGNGLKSRIIITRITSNHFNCQKNNGRLV